MDPSPWRAVLADPGAERHLVQLYRDDGFLRSAVALWAARSLRGSGGAVCIGTPEHAELLREGLLDLELPVTRLEREGRLLFLDADATMRAFIDETGPREAPFRRVLGDALSSVRFACGGETPEVRAWGEMVNMLWQRGHLAHAQRLEDMWNRAIDDEPGLRLLCSYEADAFEPETHLGLGRALCHGHSRVIPVEDEESFSHAVALAAGEVAGDAPADGETQSPPRQLAMPEAHAFLERLHAHDETRARAVLGLAKRHYGQLRRARSFSQRLHQLV